MSCLEINFRKYEIILMDEADNIDYIVQVLPTRSKQHEVRWLVEFKKG